MELSKEKLRKIIKEELLKESSIWLPSELRKEIPTKLVSSVSKQLDYDPTLAYAFCVWLLEDVNVHGMAQKINDIFIKDLKW